MKKVKLFGCERSGTNYLVTLIGKNFGVKCDTDKPHQKHDLLLAKVLLREPSVFITKNPYSWLASSYRWKVLRSISVAKKLGVPIGKETEDPGTFEGFLLCDQYRCSRRKTWASAVDSYNRRVASWLRHCTFHVRYEDLLTDLTATMGSMRAKMGLTWVKDFPEAIVTETGPIIYLHGNKVNARRRRSKWMDKRYYVDEEYMTLYSRKSLGNVNRQLDWNLMKKLGYKRKDVLK